MKRRSAVYGIAAALIAASWLGNFAYNRHYRLPEGRFLTHRIEATDAPYLAFDLYYAANKDDKRRIASIRAEGLPSLTFAPAEAYRELNRQTIYRLYGQYTSAPERTAPLPPLVVHEVDVTFGDGKTKRMDVGEIIVYRDDYPPPPEGGPVAMTSSGGSNDNSGFGSVRAVRPATLTSTSSVWLGELGGAFTYEVYVTGGPSGYGADGHFDGPSQERAAYPAQLAEGNGVATEYRFRFAPGDPHALNVYNVLLTHGFAEPDGRESPFRLHARYAPWFSEAQMKAFVRAERREDG
ncbi:hypothetical protein SAMN02799624_04764 [Paenibacillus sp. UNC496MF]|uniref:hypothetical protein n=1 Tax=Paenibacillus sp. UNC496MF TaxID=1502753 RepID=UPI0008E7296C|nr:hypothetical protein [Paenibacillus sp. UNC496MF]SFJ50023.1 hypothetical protein SAMN02799624_04764 [Paenibacillus sp. UNC496MF]